jgi:hypothetical protein
MVMFCKLCIGYIILCLKGILVCLSALAVIIVFIATLKPIINFKITSLVYYIKHLPLLCSSCIMSAAVDYNKNIKEKNMLARE